MKSRMKLFRKVTGISEGLSMLGLLRALSRLAAAAGRDPEKDERERMVAQ